MMNPREGRRFFRIPKLAASPAAARCMLIVCMLIVSALPESAMAQQQPSLALNRFDPAPAGDRFFSVQDATAGHLVPHAIVILDYAHNPLVLEYQDTNGDKIVDKVVEHQLTGHLGAALDLWNFLKLDLSIPLALYQQGSDSTVGTTTYESPSGVALGDIRLGARARLWGTKSGSFAIGLGGSVWFPSGPKSDGSFTSDGTFRGMPYLSVSGTAGRFVYAASSGVEFRESQDYGGTTQGNLFQFNAAVGALIGKEKNLQIGPEATMAMVLSDISSETTNAEALLGAKWRFHPLFVAGLGAGGGLAGGVGTPQLRALASFALSPEQKKDKDGDGILDKDDACPSVRGVANSDPEKNGCPPDTDGDGILDEKDACPHVRGVASSDPKKNGCPPDQDGDGILDADDACPTVAGEKNSDPDKNGCPPDQDGDGILDADDACPADAGQPSDDPSKNGCPDRDKDGIVDSQDACPDKWGRPNDDPKKNGCPAVTVSSTQIVITQKVQFETGSAEIKEESFSLLDEIARVIDENPGIEKVEVQGHTDSRGGLQLNMRLSKERAESVRRALIARGVAPDRMTAKGYGPSVPIDTNATAEGREANRRVEFKILKLNNKEMKQ